MQMLTWATLIDLFKTVTDWLAKLFHDSPKWMAVGTVAFMALIYFGFMKAPKIDPDAATKAQIVELSKKIDAMMLMVARKFEEAKASSAITTGSVVKHKK